MRTARLTARFGVRADERQVEMRKSGAFHQRQQFPIQAVMREAVHGEKLRVALGKKRDQAVAQAAHGVGVERQIIVLEIEHAATLRVASGDFRQNQVICAAAVAVAKREMHGAERAAMRAAARRHDHAHGALLKQVAIRRKIREIGRRQFVKRIIVGERRQDKLIAALEAEIRHARQIAALLPRGQKFDERAFALAANHEIHARMAQRGFRRGGHMRAAEQNRRVAPRFNRLGAAQRLAEIGGK